MKQQRPYARYTVSRKAQASLENGHPWVYEDEIRAVEGDAENGALVDVLSDRGRYLGTGFLSVHSKIRVRLISRSANDSFDEAFWRRRLQWAWAYRKQVLAPADLSCCRVIFGEADQFPGLTVDRFGPYLVAQTLSVGMERLKRLLFPLLAEVCLLYTSGRPRFEYGRRAVCEGPWPLCLLSSLKDTARQGKV